MMTMTIIARVKPEKQQEFLQAIGSLYDGERIKEKGLRKTTLYKEMADGNGFRLIAEWETRQDLERYLRAEKFRVLLGALKVLCQESQIRYSEKLEPPLNASPTRVVLPDRPWVTKVAMVQGPGEILLEEKKAKKS